MRYPIRLLVAIVLIAASPFAKADVCKYADALVNTAAAGVATLGVSSTLGAAGISAVAHSSGGLILSSATTGYLSGTLGTLGTIGGVILAPATLIIAGGTIASAGGAIAYCHFRQPAALKKNQSAARGPAKYAL